MYVNSVVYVIKKWKNPKLEFTNEKLTYFTKFTIQHETYVIKQSVSPKKFTNESLFTIQQLKFIYSEKATKFSEIFPLLLTVCTLVKSEGKISQNFAAFSEYRTRAIISRS